MNELKKVFKIFIMSAMICFSLVFTLMIINVIMGIFIELSFYLILLGILTLGFTFALTLFDSKKIFYSKNVKKPIKSKTASKSKKSESSHSKVRRRKVS